MRSNTDRKASFAALVLAAGYSSRMGTLKPLLPLWGSIVISHAIDALREAGVQPTAVLGHMGDAVRQDLAPLRVRWIVNAEYDSGMYSSVVAGLRSLDRGVAGCFILPADMPAVQASTIARLACAQKRTGASVVYPVFRGRRGHPPLISSRLFPAILSGDGNGGLERVLGAHEQEARELHVRDEGVVLDLDTPEDYRRVCQMSADRTVPTPAECEALLAERGVSADILRHGRAVSCVASRLASELNRAGLRLDVPLVRAASLLHDIARNVPDHARVGARVLRRLGYFRVAAAVVRHMDIEWNGLLPLDEAAVLYLADKLVSGERVVTLEERFLAAREKAGRSTVASAALEGRRKNALAIAATVGRILGAGWHELVATEG